MTSIIELLNKHDYLKDAFKFILKHNKSNLAPYHNLNHLLTFTAAVSEIMQAENHLDNEKELLLAGIFHDFNHSAGETSDVFNIMDAKKGVVDFLTQQKNISVNIGLIFSLLDATQYPYIIEVDELTKEQAIMRDADLFQVLQSNWIHQCLYGLSQESKRTFEDFVPMQIKFLELANFNTNYGKKKKEENWERLIKETEILKNIFK